MPSLGRPLAFHAPIRDFAVFQLNVDPKAGVATQIEHLIQRGQNDCRLIRPECGKIEPAQVSKRQLGNLSRLTSQTIGRFIMGDDQNTIAVRWTSSSMPSAPTAIASAKHVHGSFRARTGSAMGPDLWPRAHSG